MRSIERSARLFRSVAEGASDGLVLMERDSQIIWANEAYSRIMGYQHGELIGHYPLEFALPERMRLPEEEVRAFRFDETEQVFGSLSQRENVRKDGVEFMHEFSHAAIDLGGDKKFLLVGRDITARIAREKALVAAQEKLKVQSTTDALTGLYNRLHLQVLMEKFIDQGQDFAVLQVDVNNMKHVNDTFGHQAGDAALVHVARAFRSVAGEDWVCARTGGDEFVAIVPKVMEMKLAVDCARKLTTFASRPFKWQAGTIQVHISVGAALWDRFVQSPDELLHHSDVALYEAKTKPAPNVVGFDQVLRDKYEAQQALERDVAAAMSERRFTFHFQPIVNVETRSIERFEMLVRWRREDRESVSPSVFLPLIEHLGMVGEFDEYVVRSAERALERLEQAGLVHAGLNINLSTTAFASDDIAELLIWRAEQGLLDAQRISLEVLESTALSLTENSPETRLLEALRKTGFKLMLDDFGMGYAGLAHLAFMPIHGLKIDRRLTSTVDCDPTSRAIVIALVQLAKELKLEVVTEGVENMAQMEIIRRAGCALFQGYAVSRPMPLKRAIAWAKHDIATLAPKRKAS